MTKPVVLPRSNPIDFAALRTVTVPTTLIQLTELNVGGWFRGNGYVGIDASNDYALVMRREDIVTPVAQLPGDRFIVRIGSSVHPEGALVAMVMGIVRRGPFVEAADHPATIAVAQLTLLHDIAQKLPGYRGLNV